jgi:hypothetical protein
MLLTLYCLSLLDLHFLVTPLVTLFCLMYVWLHVIFKWVSSWSWSYGRLIQCGIFCFLFYSNVLCCCLCVFALRNNNETLYLCCILYKLHICVLLRVVCQFWFVSTGYWIGGTLSMKNCADERRRENVWGISCEKSRFYAKNYIFSNCGRKFVWVFRVKNHDFTPKNHIFSNTKVRWHVLGVSILPLSWILELLIQCGIFCFLFYSNVLCCFLCMYLALKTIVRLYTFVVFFINYICVFC